MVKHQPRRPSLDDANQVARIVCELAAQAVKMILALRGVR
jgi:hypothetical protein